MMTNLFSMFDPCTGILSLNWMSMMLIFLLPLNFWLNISKPMLMINKMLNKMSNEMILNTKNHKPIIMFVSIFMYILINNLMGMLPYVFTASSQLVFSMTLAMAMWISIMLFGWINKTNLMFIHLVPSGTPYMLMPFMVIIESISNMMRPGSLAVRLSANMIAGHILMSLLGANMGSNLMMSILMFMFMGLMLFEMAVAFIQSYVFTTLSSLYFSEI